MHNLQRTKPIVNPDNLSAEFRLLLACVRINGSQINNLITDSIDWQAFKKLCFRHGVFPLVYQTLSKIQNQAIPPTLINELKLTYIQNSIRMLRLSKELGHLTETLAGQSIRALALKGPSLAWQLYSDTGLRISTDLDLLISPTDIFAAENILFQQGYKRVFPEPKMSLNAQKLYMRAVHHYSYRHDIRDINLELHWKLDNYGILKTDFNELWHNSSQILLHNTAVHLLSAEDNFLFLSVHGAKHGWTHLQWLCDLATLTHKNTLTWTEIIKKAKHSGIENVLAQVHLLTSSFLDTPLPEDSSLIFDTATIKLAATAGTFLSEPEPTSERLRDSIYMYRLCGFSSLLGYLQPHASLLTSVNLPQPLQPLYYILNPLYRSGRVAGRGLKRIRFPH